MPLSITVDTVRKLKLICNTLLVDIEKGFDRAGGINKAKLLLGSDESLVSEILQADDSLDEQILSISRLVNKLNSLEEYLQKDKKQQEADKLYQEIQKRDLYAVVKEQADSIWQIKKTIEELLNKQNELAQLAMMQEQLEELEEELEALNNRVRKLDEQIQHNTSELSENLKEQIQEFNKQHNMSFSPSIVERFIERQHAFKNGNVSKNDDILTKEFIDELDPKERLKLTVIQMIHLRKIVLDAVRKSAISEDNQERIQLKTLIDGKTNKVRELRERRNELITQVKPNIEETVSFRPH